MRKNNDTSEDSNKLSNISRRSFLKGAVAAGVAVSAYGCGKDGGEVTYKSGSSDSKYRDDEYYTKTPKYRYGTSAHNCGGRCIIKAQVTEDGRIVRFLTDESLTASADGQVVDIQHRNSPQFRACSRCRAYKGRLYHPGRLKYPLKQTKKRGDVTGFVRVSWDEALKDIADRMKAVQDKYGPETVHAIYACGNIYSEFQSASYAGVFASNDQVSPALRLLGGSAGYTSDYSFHQCSYAGGWYGTAYTGLNLGSECIKPTTDSLAGKGKYVVLWGSNVPTTHNPLAFPWVKSIEDMKKNIPGSKVIFIGPELSEVGISSADEWIQLRPYTDVALIMAMFHEMIVNTFNSDGSIKQDPWLDVDYLDTMVYGFFDSPEYWINPTDSQISLTNPNNNAYRKVEEVAAGKSLADYIMGSDVRLSKATYGSSNYIAKQFENRVRGGKSAYPSKANSIYMYKRDMLTPKTPEWAEKITGVPAKTIRELAKMYCDAGKDTANNRIWNEWAGGQLKQAEGVVTLMTLQLLCIITKQWGYTGTGVMNQGINPNRKADPGQFTNTMIKTIGGKIDGSATLWADIPAMREHPQISVAQWHNAIKFAFGNELKANGYKPTNIYDYGKDYTETGYAYLDNGGVKSLIKRPSPTDMSTPIPTYTDNGRTYFDYEGRSEGAPVYSGFRFILNTGGNIPVNQHPNCKDLTNMYGFLPTFGYGDFSVDDMAEAFYLVTFDNFMSPTARYSDYVLPAKTTWEQEDFKSLDESGGTFLYIDDVIKGPGESKSTWDFARDLIKVKSGDDAAIKFTGDKADTTFKQVVQKQFKIYSKQKTIGEAKNPHYNKTWEEFLEKPYCTPTYSENVDESNTGSQLREELNKYLSGDKQQPFVSKITTVDATNAYGFGNGQFAETDTCPQQSGRFHAYSGSLVWRYENAYSKWHGHLPVEKQGQSNKDKENDPIVYPIPMYFHYQDYFAESYGMKADDLTRANGYYLLTTTHDRFRAHSSQSENPFLRELTHRVKGGELYSGNDSGNYAVSSNPSGDMNEFPNLNSLIGANGQPTDETKASYTDIWVNPDDFANFKDGDLVKVSNPIGAVYCTIRKTKRCVRGYVGLHQGCWYDPRVINGETIDVGGNCNTLMATRPSRMDHGNAAQSAMVKIERV